LSISDSDLHSLFRLPSAKLSKILFWFRYGQVCGHGNEDDEKLSGMPIYEVI
jgi:hypothetical protein